MDSYNLSKTMKLRMEAFEYLKKLFANETQDCCGSPIGFALFVFDCRSTLCSGNVDKEGSINIVQEWLTNEFAGNNFDPFKSKNELAN